ncbi:hypothetical protein Pelo_2840 [Pelomyxa schiedti]|nr:hypothetical protein Pelo_2840 [Pelomyxa schiedti]
MFLLNSLMSQLTFSFSQTVPPAIREALIKILQNYYYFQTIVMHISGHFHINRERLNDRNQSIHGWLVVFSDTVLPLLSTTATAPPPEELFEYYLTFSQLNWLATTIYSLKNCPEALVIQQKFRREDFCTLAWQFQQRLALFPSLKTHPPHPFPWASFFICNPVVVNPFGGGMS